MIPFYSIMSDAVESAEESSGDNRSAKKQKCNGTKVFGGPMDDERHFLATNSSICGKTSTAVIVAFFSASPDTLEFRNHIADILGVVRGRDLRIMRELEEGLLHLNGRWGW